MTCCIEGIGGASAWLTFVIVNGAERTGRVMLAENVGKLGIAAGGGITVAVTIPEWEPAGTVATACRAQTFVVAA